MQSITIPAVIMQSITDSNVVLLSSAALAVPSLCVAGTALMRAGRVGGPPRHSVGWVVFSEFRSLRWP